MGPLIDEFPGSAGGLLLEGPVGDGLVAAGLLVEGLAADGDPGELAPEPVELLELPELLCAIATPPDNRKAARVTADVAFIVISMVAPWIINKSR